VRTGFRGKTKAIEHNGYVVGEKLYVAHYTRGLIIYDASNPNKLKEIGSFDTYPLHDDTQGAGAWGVYPFLPSGNILVSDIQRGLFILKEE
jgi:choice-of-anchor B domain-containing protein